MSKIPAIYIVGSTGAVGRRMLTELSRLGYQDAEVHAMASPRSAGSELVFGNRSLRVEAFDLKLIKPKSVVLLSAGGEFSRQYAGALVDRGATVIDNSSAWRMAEGVPLVVPEVNGGLLSNWSGEGIIANPNCSTVQLVVTLAPLQAKFGIKAVFVASYQSTSGAGQKGMADLEAGLRSGAAPSYLPRPIVGNVIPAIDVISSLGHCFEEEKIVRETRKILRQDEIQLLATTARVPTRVGHCEAVSVELSTKVTRRDVLDAFRHAAGVYLVEDDSYEAFPTLAEWEGKSEVLVARVRLPLDQDSSNLIQYWNMADNLAKGAATNAVQIMRCLFSNA